MNEKHFTCGLRRALGLAALVSLFVATVHCGSAEDGSVFCEGGPCPEIASTSGPVSPPWPPIDVGSDPRPDNVCAGLDVTLEKVVPTVVLLVDQSSSMEYDLAGTTLLPPGAPGSRWTLLRDSLMDPERGVVKRYEDDVDLGLALYSANNGNEKPPAVAACPLMKTVPTARGNHAAMNALYEAELPVDDTPTGDAVLAAAGLDANGVPVAGGLAAAATGRPKFLVLATDGEPGMCGGFDSLERTGAPAAQQAVVQAVRAAYRAGIKTYVISVGSGLSEAHQQEVANAGLGYAPSSGSRAPLLRTHTQAELASAFDTVIFGARSCSFRLSGRITPGSEAKGEVTVNGVRVPFGSPDGWRVVSDGEIELVGAACNMVKTTQAKVSARFACGAFVPR